MGTTHVAAVRSNFLGCSLGNTLVSEVETEGGSSDGMSDNDEFMVDSWSSI